jgi:hypothetical protein
MPDPASYYLTEAGWVFFQDDPPQIISWVLPVNMKGEVICKTAPRQFQVSVWKSKYFEGGRGKEENKCISLGVEWRCINLTKEER